MRNSAGSEACSGRLPCMGPRMDPGEAPAEADAYAVFVTVLEIGPDVPESLKITKGSVVFLRSDTKIFGIDDKQQIGLVPFQMIMAVKEDDGLKIPTDEEINRVASGQ